MSERPVEDSGLVAISSLHFHPLNPNQGNLDVIRESLEVNGQYAPVLVHKESRTIIAGNSTVKAAKALGWTKVSVDWFHGTEAEALEILLNDNKSADGGVIDPALAFTLLSSLPSTEGTGYALEDLAVPAVDLSLYDPDPDAQADEKPDEDRPEPTAPADPGFRLGPWKGAVRFEEYDKWRSHFPGPVRAATKEVLLLLGLVVPESVAPEGSAVAEFEKVPLSELKQYPGNPNHGDVGLLTVLLARYGQTRRIVASRRTNRILRGNHVAKAAEQLGWTHIGVSWVDVDEDGEKRIVLVDNRSRQLASYDLPALGRALSMVGRDGFENTGYSLSDLDDIIAGRSPKIAQWTRAEMSFELGNLRAKVRTDLVRELHLTPGQELREVAAILGLDPDAVTQAG